MKTLHRRLRQLEQQRRTAQPFGLLVLRHGANREAELSAYRVQHGQPPSMTIRVLRAKA